MLVINPQSKVERIGFVSPRLKLASPSGILWFVASLGKTADSSLPISSHPFPVELQLPFLVLCHSGCGLAISVSWRSQSRSQALRLSNTPRFLLAQSHLQRDLDLSLRFSRVSRASTDSLSTASPGLCSAHSTQRASAGGCEDSPTFHKKSVRGGKVTLPSTW